MDLASLDKKQKIMIPVLGLLILFILWQGYKLFAPSTSSTTPPAASTGTTMNAAGQQVVEVPAVKIIQETGPTPEDLLELARAKQLHDQYLTLVNQYQISQMQKLLAETSAAIASANASTAKSKLDEAKSVSETQSYVPKGMIETEGGVLRSSGSDAPYKLSFIGQKNGRWTAILTQEDQYFDVTIGSRLPDGTEVVSINMNSVLISKDLKRSLLKLPPVPRSLMSPPPVKDDKNATN